MARVFISHSNMDNAQAVAIRDWLASQGWDDVFLDLDPKRGIAAGDRWERALTDAARRCEAVIFLVSRSWLASEWCGRELALASKLNKRLFGVLIEDIALSDIPLRITAVWQLVRLSSGRDHSVFNVTLPITGETKQVTFSSEGLTRLKAGLMQAGLDPRFFAWPPEADSQRPPYRGLLPLEAEDAGIFYGREAEILDALDKLRGLKESAAPRLFVILGASGAGKSSFLRAGLWPRLRRDDRAFLPLPVIRPERNVLSGDAGLVRSLDEAFKAVGSPRARAEIRSAVDGGIELLKPLLAELAAKAAAPSLDGEAPKPPMLVFCVDQGEELFISDGAAEAESFANLLRDIVANPEVPSLALITIRSDAYEHLQTATAFQNIVPQIFSLPPLIKGAYLEVIEGPPRRLSDTSRALRIEPALPAALLSDIEAGGAKDALPLLAFTLERLYFEYGSNGNLTLRDYNALGRIKGSIEAAVEGALKASNADPAVPRDRQAKLTLLRRGLIPWLAGIDPDTKAPRRRVARLSEIPAEARPLIDHLVNARLLSTDRDMATGETTIEPSHEALLRQWGLLEGWLKEDFAELASLEGVKRAATEWASNAKAEAWLAHRRGRLEEAERVAARGDLSQSLTPTEREYLSGCRQAENDNLKKQRRRTRLAIWGSLTAAFILAVAAAYATYQGLIARREKERSDLAFEMTSGFFRSVGGTADTFPDVVRLILSVGTAYNGGLPQESIADIQGRLRKSELQQDLADQSNPSLKVEIIDKYIDSFDLNKLYQNAFDSLPPLQAQLTRRLVMKLYEGDNFKKIMQPLMFNNYSLKELRALVSVQKLPVGTVALEKMGPLMRDMLPSLQQNMEKLQADVVRLVTSTPRVVQLNAQKLKALQVNDYEAAANAAIQIAQEIENNETSFLGEPVLYSLLSLDEAARLLMYSGRYGDAGRLIEKMYKIQPNFAWVDRLKAHLLTCTGRSSEANLIYLKHRGETLADMRSTWENQIASDFKEFKTAGLWNADFEKVAVLLRLR